MAGEVTASQLNANFKIAYADKIELLPEYLWLQKKIGFKVKRLGKSFDTPVMVNREQGLYWALGGAGAVTYNDAIPTKLENSSIDGSQMFIRSRIDFEAAGKGSSGKESFQSSIGLVIDSQMESAHQALEGDLLYGRSGYAEVESSGTIVGLTGKVKFKKASFAPGLWNGRKGVQVEFFSGTGASVTKRGTFATLTTVDLDGRDFTFTFDTSVPSISAGDHVYLRTQRAASTYAQMVGLHGIMTNTGTFAGIDAATYPDVWTAASVNASSGPLSVDLVHQAVRNVMNKGGLESEYILLVNPGGFVDLLYGQDSLIRHDASYDGKIYTLGADEICIKSQGAKVTVLSHPCVKEGD